MALACASRLALSAAPTAMVGTGRGHILYPAVFLRKQLVRQNRFAWRQGVRENALHHSQILFKQAARVVKQAVLFAQRLYLRCDLGVTVGWHVGE